MPQKQNKGLKRLLEAEAKANEIVKQAKKDRLIKLKRAKEEAEIEIEKFKAEKQAEFEAYKKQVTTFHFSTTINQNLMKFSSDCIKQKN